ncbi:MAG: hypothetical protein HQK77_21235 [Desulfobacterales bacterium]|nr:hypothetical protein [Desulfobacterales bacterium]
MSIIKKSIIAQYVTMMNNYFKKKGITVAIIFLLCLMIGIPTFSLAGTVEFSKTLYLFPLNKLEFQDGQINITNLNRKQICLYIEAYSREGVLLENIDLGVIDANNTKSVGIKTLPERTESVKIMSDNIITATAINIKADGNTIQLSAVSEISNQFNFSVFNRNQFDIKFVLLNPNSVNTGVNVIALDNNGKEVRNNFFTSLVPMEISAFSLIDIFDGFTLEGLSEVRLESEKNIIANRTDDYQEFNSNKLIARISSKGSGDKAIFISETLPDNTRVDGGKTFTKTWTIKNSGTTTWNSSYKLKYVSNSGGRLSSSNQVVSGTVKPGSSYTFTVHMTAPVAQASDKTYKEDWKLTDPLGNTISGGSVWVKIIVPAKKGTVSQTGSIPQIISFDSKSKWPSGYCPTSFEGYFKVAYQGYNIPDFRITVNGTNLDKVTRVTLHENNYREAVTVHTKTSSALLIEIDALTNFFSDTSPKAEANPTLRFYYNDAGVEKYVENTTLKGLLPTYNNAGQSWGQCTWYAGFIKMLQNKRTPCIGYNDENFVVLNGDPNSKGFPKPGSILYCIVTKNKINDSKHMAYVESVENATEKKNSDGSSDFTHKIHVSDYNAACSAAFRSDYTATMVVKKSKTGSYSILTKPILYQYSTYVTTVTYVRQ